MLKKMLSLMSVWALITFLNPVVAGEVEEFEPMTCDLQYSVAKVAFVERVIDYLDAEQVHEVLVALEAFKTTGEFQVIDRRASDHYLVRFSEDVLLFYYYDPNVGGMGDLIIQHAQPCVE